MYQPTTAARNTAFHQTGNIKMYTQQSFLIALFLDWLQGKEFKDKIEGMKDVLEQLRKITGLVTWKIHLFSYWSWKAVLQEPVQVLLACKSLSFGEDFYSPAAPLWEDPSPLLIPHCSVRTWGNTFLPFLPFLPFLGLNLWKDSAGCLFSLNLQEYHHFKASAIRK